MPLPCIDPPYPRIAPLANGVVDRTYLHGARGPEYERTGTGSPVWNLYDGLGSVLGTVDAAGNLVSTRKYDVYGAVRGSTGPSGTKHKFVGSLGHSSEDETGLVYMRARYYDPITGRFASEDPIFSGLNWYVYCDGNPINRVDPSGEIYGDDDKAAADVAAYTSMRGTIANFKFARTYSSRVMKGKIRQILGCSDDEAGGIIHEAKRHLGGNPDIALDSAGGLSSKTGDFLGFSDEFLGSL